MTPHEALIEARALVAHGWAQGCMACDANGVAVAYYDNAATCFCLTGAIARACEVIARFEDAGVLRKVVEGLFTDFKDADGRVHSGVLSVFNDASGRTQQEVLAVLDKAIMDMDT